MHGKSARTQKAATMMLHELMHVSCGFAGPGFGRSFAAGWG